MNCREFRLSHLDYTDGTLGPSERAAAQAHMDACADCARFDCRIRRGALLVRNLPSVVPRPGFQSRLMARIGAEREERARSRRMRGRAIAAAAALIAVAAGVFVAMARSEIPIPLAPAIAAASAAKTAPAAARGGHPMMMRRDFMAAASSGIPLWPAATLLDAAPARFAGTQSLPFAPSR